MEAFKRRPYKGRRGDTRVPDPLHEAVAGWLAAIDTVEDARRHGAADVGFALLRDELADLARLASAAEPGPLRDAVLDLAAKHDDLCLLAESGVGATLSAEARAAVVARVTAAFAAVAALVEGDPSGPAKDE